MNAVGPEDAELTLLVSPEINKSAVALASASQGDLVNRSNALRIFVLKQDNGLAIDWSGQTKIRKFDDFAGGRLLGEGRWGLRHRVHLTIEAEVMYPLK